jgi:peptide/nickel transport system permease protein
VWKIKGHKRKDAINTTVLFILYSLPSFWIGTLLLVFFTTAEYSPMLDWFPTSGAQDLELARDPNTTWWAKVLDAAHHLVLPIFCITYGSLAYLSRQMRGAMLGVLRQDYIRTARAKGLNEHKILWKHAFRNALFPIITMFSSIFPRAISGSIAIELIYAIPGMGQLVLSSIVARDWPVVFTVVMLVAILTMIGNLIADILYAIVDPRLSYKA